MSAPRTGRPINFRLDPEIATKVEAAAKMEGVTLAEWWTRAARQRLEIVDEVVDLLREAHAATRTARQRLEIVDEVVDLLREAHAEIKAEKARK